MLHLLIDRSYSQVCEENTFVLHADVEVRKVASVTVNIYQVELALVVVVSCFSRPSVLRYEHPPMEQIQGTGCCSRFENEIHDDK